MSRMIFILGGARSGKSAHAVDLAKRTGKRTVFVATAGALDEEMKDKIRLHKTSRPKSWGLIEEPVDLGGALSGLKSSYGVVLIDCIGLWISNLLMADMKNKSIEKRVEGFISSILKSKTGLVIVVSNDVGSGIVPGDPLSRRFRDLVGLANQAIAERANEVISMQAGIPVRIK